MQTLNWIVFGLALFAALLHICLAWRVRDSKRLLCIIGALLLSMMTVSAAFTALGQNEMTVQRLMARIVTLLLLVSAWAAYDVFLLRPARRNDK